MKNVQFNLRRMFAAVVLVAFGWSLMLRLETPSSPVFIAGCVLIGACFGAAVGLIANRLKSFTLIGAGGWLIFSICALAG